MSASPISGAGVTKKSACQRVKEYLYSKVYKTSEMIDFKKESAKVTTPVKK